MSNSIPPAREPDARDAPRYAELGVWIKQHLGIVYSPSQRLQFIDRLRRYIADRGVTLEQLLEALRRGDPIHRRGLAEVMSTNYTFFMRENETFELLRQRVFPQLPAGEFRVWSAATSSGDEAYTFAIHCLEHFGLDGPKRVKILGTDISQRQIARAESGIYPLDHLSLVDAGRRSRWFEPASVDGHFQVAQRLRDMCTFRRMNLTQFPWPFEQQFTIILLRNVLFYFDPATCERIIEACFDVAAPTAWLVSSITEPMLDLETRWQRLAPGLYRKG